MKSNLSKYAMLLVPSLIAISAHAAGGTATIEARPVIESGRGGVEVTPETMNTAKPFVKAAPGVKGGDVVQVQDVTKVARPTAQADAELSCPVDPIKNIADDTGVDAAEVRAQVAEGYLGLTGTCGHDVTNLKKDLKTRLVRATQYLRAHDAIHATSEKALELGADAFDASFSADNIKVPRAQLLDKAYNLGHKADGSGCSWVMPSKTLSAPTQAAN